MSKRRVVINLRSGKALRGIRKWTLPWHVKITSAEIMGPNIPLHTIDGVVIIPREQIDFMQAWRA